MSITETFDPDSQAIINPSQLGNKVPGFSGVTVAVVNMKFIKLRMEDFGIKHLIRKFDYDD